MRRQIIQVNERPPLLQSIPLSLQHLFAMFGASVLVPMLFKTDPGTVLLFQWYRYFDLSVPVFR